MNSRHSLLPPGRCLIAALLLAIGTWSMPAGAAQMDETGATAAVRSADAVGKVTLALGKALVIDAAGQAQAVRTGSQIHVGDRIETAEGGHVHIRFVDGALVSVRPTSRLVVEDYQYDARQVEKSLVRFRLDQGVARAISGAAAEGARERFRLNTPLVAIGVRGTDFVVRTDAVQTLASVNQGAIVVAPFGGECQRQATGPCGTGSARLLTASMGQMLVEYRDQFAQPEIRPINNLAGSGGIAVASSSTSMVGGTSSGSGTTSTGSGSTTATAGSGNSNGTTTVVARSTESLTLQSHKTSSVGDEAVSAVLVQGAVHLVGSEVQKSPGTSVTHVPQAPLVWGRWTESALMAGDITIPRSSLREARKNDDVIGFGDYILFRDGTTASVLAPQLGVLGFSLQQSQAQFIAANGARQAASVLGGSLTLDFASRQFNTLLQLTSAATGNVGLQASGELTQQGAFYSYGAGQSLAGAVALDAKSAGYTFEKAAAGGSLNGITMWGR